MEPHKLPRKENLDKIDPRIIMCTKSSTLFIYLFIFLQILHTDHIVFESHHKSTGSDWSLNHIIVIELGDDEIKIFKNIN